MRNLPRRAAAGVFRGIAATMAMGNKELARALPDSKGGETPKSQQVAKTSIYTYFTVADGDTKLLYSAENWVRIKLVLETAGPVSIGTNANISPTLSGRGRLLDTDAEFEVTLPKGTRMYIVSETVNRIGVTVEPIPWMEQISGEINDGFGRVVAAISQGAQAISAVFDAVRGKASPTTPGGTAPSQLPVPSSRPKAIQLPRLTRLPGGKRMPR